MHKFWNWSINTENELETPERELRIDGTIAEDSWWDDDVTPKQFRDELMRAKGNVTLWINSPGGDCFAASEIYTMLKEYSKTNGKITVKIDGIAASAASVIAMAGDTVMMSPTAMMMIHNPSTLAWGDTSEMEKAISMLAEVKESIINAYELKTGMQRAKISRLMDEETWMNARKAVELGFADETIGDTSDSAEGYSFSGKAAHDTMMQKAVAKMKNEPPKASGKSTNEFRKELFVKILSAKK